MHVLQYDIEALITNVFQFIPWHQRKLIAFQPIEIVYIIQLL